MYETILFFNMHAFVDCLKHFEMVQLIQYMTHKVKHLNTTQISSHKMCIYTQSQYESDVWNMIQLALLKHETTISLNDENIALLDPYNKDERLAILCNISIDTKEMILKKFIEERHQKAFTLTLELVRDTDEFYKMHINHIENFENFEKKSV